MLIDSYHRYVTSRDSHKVRIYATDAGGDYPVHGAIYNRITCEWTVATWTKEGLSLFGTKDHSLDLVLAHDEEDND
jgi:hypothetical protein